MVTAYAREEIVRQADQVGLGRFSDQTVQSFNPFRHHYSDL